MDIKESQKDMRLAYMGGSSGVFASGVIWLLAGIVAMYASTQNSILVFFFGGMLIFPLSILISKLFKRAGKHADGNSLGTLAMEGTIILFVGLFIAYAIFQVNQEWFFPVMLMIIGGRYMTFQTIYGMKAYWVLGVALVAAGVFFMLSSQPFYLAALVGGIIEVLFSTVIFRMEKG